MPVGVLHVCDKFGVRGSSIHGVSRLFSWWFARFDTGRFDVGLVGLKHPEPATDGFREIRKKLNLANVAYDAPPPLRRRFTRRVAVKMAVAALIEKLRSRASLLIVQTPRSARSSRITTCGTVRKPLERTFFCLLANSRIISGKSFVTCWPKSSFPLIFSLYLVCIHPAAPKRRRPRLNPKGAEAHLLHI